MVKTRMIDRGRQMEKICKIHMGLLDTRNSNHHKDYSEMKGKREKNELGFFFVILGS